MSFARFAAIVVLPALTMCAQLLFRSAIDDRGVELNVGSMLRLLTHPHLMLGVVLQGTGFLFWLFIISRLKLAEAFGTVGAVFYLVVALVGWAVLDEALRPVQLLGLLAISAGVLALSLG